MSVVSVRLTLGHRSVGVSQVYGNTSNIAEIQIYIYPNLY